MSRRKTDANRRNAQHSTGPRSVEGKARSAGNARKHGLASTPTDPAAVDFIERLTRVVVGDATDDGPIADLARQIAAAEYDLLRIQRARLLLFERVAAAGEGAAELEALDRYERRALSRRRRLITNLALQGAR
jgi:hypothetical protein